MLSAAGRPHGPWQGRRDCLDGYCARAKADHEDRAGADAVRTDALTIKGNLAIML